MLSTRSLKLSAGSDDEEDEDKCNEKDDIMVDPLVNFRSSQKNINASTSSLFYSAKECPICLDTYKIGDDIAWSKNEECHHAFHLDCVMSWLMENDNCPLCRADYLMKNGAESTRSYDN